MITFYQIEQRLKLAESIPVSNDRSVLMPSYAERSRLGNLTFIVPDLLAIIRQGKAWHKYPKFDNLPSGDIIYEILPRQGVNGTLNNLAKKYCESYEYIGFLGDDNWVRTHGWDEKLINSIEDLPYGIAYGNDLIQEDKIPTTVIMNSNIIRTLGFMAPPKIKHMYIDNFWKDLGLGLNSLRYLPDVIIEHMHFSKNKAPIDNMYILTNNSEAFLRDEKEYSKYIAEEFSQDLIKFNQIV